MKTIIKKGKRSSLWSAKKYSKKYCTVDHSPDNTYPLPPKQKKYNKTKK